MNKTSDSKQLFRVLDIICQQPASNHTIFLRLMAQNILIPPHIWDLRDAHTPKYIDDTI